MPLPHPPWQQNLQNLPRIYLNVNGGFDEYRRVMRLKKHREIRIGLSTFRGVPITSDPEGGFSYHVLHLYDPDNPGVCAELLICDQNQYILAFRRMVDSIWSVWFCFEDQQEDMPNFLDSTPLSFDGRHTGKTTIPSGPSAAFNDIYRVLTNPASSDKQLRKALLRAIILFCEATRIWAVLRAMMLRITGVVVQEELGDLLWLLIRKWQKMSNYCLYLRNKVLVIGGDGVEEVEPQVEQEMDRQESYLLELLAGCGLNNLDEVIGLRGQVGIRGQLRLILLNTEYYLHYGPVLQFPNNYVDDFREGYV